MGQARGHLRATVRAVAAGVVMIGSALVAPHQAFADSQLLFVAPNSGPAGTAVTVTGTGWNPTYYSDGFTVTALK